MPGTDTAPYWYNLKSGERRWQRPEDNATLYAESEGEERYTLATPLRAGPERDGAAAAERAAAEVSAAPSSAPAGGGGQRANEADLQEEESESGSDGEAELVGALNRAQRAASESLGSDPPSPMRVIRRKSLGVPIRAPPNPETSWEVFRDARRRTDADSAFAAERAKKLQSMDSLRAEIEKDMAFLADLDADAEAEDAHAIVGELRAELDAPARAVGGGDASTASSAAAALKATTLDVASLATERSAREAQAHNTFVRRRRALQNQIAQQKLAARGGGDRGAPSSAPDEGAAGSSAAPRRIRQVSCILCTVTYYARIVVTI